MTFSKPIRTGTTALLLAGVVVLGTMARSAQAELLYFEKGGRVQSPALLEADRVKIELPGSSYEFRRDDFRKIEPGYAPDREWAEHRQQALAKGFPARYEALWWAIENGLAAEAAAEARELHRLDPKHAPTARMAAALDRLDRPTSDPEFSEFQKALGVPMTVARGPHVLLLHQRDEPEASERIALLERVITDYYLFFAAQGLELKVPARRLIFVWFGDQTAYLAFLQSQNARAFASTRGYFHPTWNAVVSYDSRNSDSNRQLREAAQARRDELRRFQDLVDGLSARTKVRVTLTGESARTLDRTRALALAGRLEREIRRQELLSELDRRAVDEGTAAHEMVHLLAANSGLRPRHDLLPFWLQEGIAMQFEVVRGGCWAGIGRANDLRLPDWRRIQPAPRLESLVRDTGYGRGYQRDLYAQSWALVFFLRSQHPARFLTFLDLLRGPDATLSDLAPSDRWLTVFQRAFGSDLDALENEWMAFMSTVQTPLEHHAPPPERASPKPGPSRGGGAAARRRIPD
ncbi:MAG: DUF1570 domain-containing protein [Isosphaeraceae bacterium]